MLDRDAMAVPTKAADDVVAGHRLVAGDNVLDGAGEDVTIVGEASSEGRAIVENVLREALGAAELGGEGVDPGPEGKGFFLLGGEGEVLAFTYAVHCGRQEIGESPEPRFVPRWRRRRRI